jgi:hypothetical protein
VWLLIAKATDALPFTATRCVAHKGCDQYMAVNDYQVTLLSDQTGALVAQFNTLREVPWPTQGPIPTPVKIHWDGPIPSPELATSPPDLELSPRERVNLYWNDVDDVGCMGMVAPDSLEQVAAQADLIVLGRPLGSQPWPNPPYGAPFPQTLVSFQVSEVLKGDSAVSADGIVQIWISADIPRSSVSDLDHLLFLMRLFDDDRVFYLGDGYMSVFANVDGRVVTAHYQEVKHTYRSGLFLTALDGSSFDHLVTRVRDDVSVDAATMELLARRGYFAC